MTPHVEAAEYLGAYKLRLTFSDGRTGILNLEHERWGEMFEPLRDVEMFKRFSIDRELRTLVWPNGADLAPEYLYAAAA
ncbi:MAG: DUF2442 domain-containing protein [Gammaproteobacteria bacterium]|nr:DUF2442 domain-containing protein [Gammaproteobacteria bacterium]MBI5617518.1 DUF2442 domain-containing protein [Gammaproteobacteria bacterium]